VANGANEIVSIRVDKEKVDWSDLEMIQEMIAAACTQAIKNATPTFSPSWRVTTASG
jgi:DNA-binding protein YbaB